MSPAFKSRAARNIVGERVREARQRFEPLLTQDQLAGRLASMGVQLDRVAIAKIENGIRCVFDYEVKALASVLKVEAAWLLGIGATASQRSRKSQT